MRYISLLSFAFISLVLTGCEQTAAPPASATPEATEAAFRPAADFPRYYSEEAASLSTEDFAAHLEALAELGPLAEPKVVPSAEDLHTYEAFLKKHEGEVYHPALEQTLAFFVLETIFRPGSGATSYLDTERSDLSDQEQAAVSFATRLLVKHENPNADLLLVALRALEGYWPEAELQAAARIAEEAAEEAIRVECPGCDERLAQALAQEPGGRRQVLVQARNELLRLAE